MVLEPLEDNFVLHFTHSHLAPRRRPAGERADVEILRMGKIEQIIHQDVVAKICLEIVVNGFCAGGLHIRQVGDELGISQALIAQPYPNQTMPLNERIARNMHVAPDIPLWVECTTPLRIKPEAVITALHDIAVQLAAAERSEAVWTAIEYGRRRAILPPI